MPPIRQIQIRCRCRASLEMHFRFSIPQVLRPPQQTRFVLSWALPPAISQILSARSPLQRGLNPTPRQPMNAKSSNLRAVQEIHACLYASMETNVKLALERQAGMEIT